MKLENGQSFGPDARVGVELRSKMRRPGARCLVRHAVGRVLLADVVRESDSTVAVTDRRYRVTIEVGRRGGYRGPRITTWGTLGAAVDWIEGRMAELGYSAGTLNWEVKS